MSQQLTDDAGAGDDKGLEASIQYAKKYLEDILSFFGLNTDVHVTTIDDEIIELTVPSTNFNGFLIGQRGETLRAMQFMVSNSLKNNGYATQRVNVDIANYKKQRADRLVEQAGEWIAQVKESGQPMDLHPMNSADRRTVHQTAADAGILSESAGFGRERHIILKPAE